MTTWVGGSVMLTQCAAESTHCGAMSVPPHARRRELSATDDARRADGGVATSLIPRKWALSAIGAVFPVATR
eukprot:scaffold12588_cov129-Isochrysis_galbana.AAC.1